MAYFLTKYEKLTGFSFFLFPYILFPFLLSSKLRNNFVDFSKDDDDDDEHDFILSVRLFEKCYIILHYTL